MYSAASNDYNCVKIHIMMSLVWNDQVLFQVCLKFYIVLMLYTCKQILKKNHILNTLLLTIAQRHSISR